MQRRFLNERDAFPRSTDEYAQQVERFLQLRRADMDEGWGKLEEGWKKNNERLEEVGLAARTNKEDVVKLNVGGLNIRVFWHLLAQTKAFVGSTLGALLEGVWGEGRIPRDADGCIVLDESPACIKHIIAHTTLRANGCAGSVAAGLPESSAPSVVAADEVPGLIYTAHLVGLPGYVPAYPKYLKFYGGSTILEPFEIAPLGAKIREWVGGSAEQTMELIYRATRDGFDPRAFKPKCKEQYPNVLSLIRVRPDQESDTDSVVGSYSALPWGTGVGTYQVFTDDTFMFMLKDGSATDKDPSKPIKWNPFPEDVGLEFERDQEFASFAGNDLNTKPDATSGGCTLLTGRSSFVIKENSPYLALNGSKIVDIEVYHFTTRASPTTTASTTNRPGGGALTDAEAHDIDSFGRSIASSLMEERMVLNRAQREMRVAGVTVSAAVRALKTMYGPSVAAGEQDAVVELNVRGTRMTTLRSTLQACPRSALATMFDAERWPATDKDKDEHGRRLIDCNPICFSKILDVLRMRKRASWRAGATPEEQEGSSGKCSGAIAVKKADMRAFRAAVHMYFPGCESFILGLCSVHHTQSA